MEIWQTFESGDSKQTAGKKKKRSIRGCSEIQASFCGFGENTVFEYCARIHSYLTKKKMNSFGKLSLQAAYFRIMPLHFVLFLKPLSSGSKKKKGFVCILMKKSRKNVHFWKNIGFKCRFSDWHRMFLSLLHHLQRKKKTITAECLNLWKKKLILKETSMFSRKKSISPRNAKFSH